MSLGKPSPLHPVGHLPPCSWGAVPLSISAEGIAPGWFLTTQPVSPSLSHRSWILQAEQGSRPRLKSSQEEDSEERD